MAKVYRIKDWNKFYENNKSRDRDQCSFCCIPNKQDGLGYGLLMSEENGEALYGAFVAVVLVCSKHRMPRNGYLTANGLPTGYPLDARLLSVKCKFSVGTVHKMLEVCSKPEHDGGVGWIELIDVNPDVPLENGLRAGEVPIECPSGALEGKEGKGKKEGEGIARAPGVPFAEVPTFEEAFAQTMNDGIPLDFCRYVFDDWTSRAGKDANGVDVEWRPYVKKRWVREQVEWTNGTHKGKKAPARLRSGPTSKEVEAYAREKVQDAAKAISLAASFFRYWNERDWQKDGVPIDWKIKLSEYLSKQK